MQFQVTWVYKVELSPLLVCLAVSYEGFGHWWWW